MVTNTHNYINYRDGKRLQGNTYQPINIEDNVWIGANCVILGGVRIVNGTVVAAGSVVNKSLDKTDSIYGGIPAKQLKKFVKNESFSKDKEEM
jgi:acetyltransferase-like isoleucine patch superfamily enzyme